MSRPTLPPLLTGHALEEWRAGVTGSLVIANGVFDLFHPGHERLLRAAAAAGDALLVAINTDDSVRRLKGPSRPFEALAERVARVQLFPGVAAITAFDEDTPLLLIRRLRPNVLVKGSDYTEDQIAGARDVQSWGGRVLIVPRGHESTSGVAAARGAR